MSKQPRLMVGGQAVVEGVMMRSPRCLAVAVRRINGEIVLKESIWRVMGEKVRFLRWPFIRGAVVLLESLVNGVSALNFSAKIAMEDAAAAEQPDKGDKGHDANLVTSGTTKDPRPQIEGEGKKKELSDWALFATVGFALLLGVGLFIALPHWAVWLGSVAAGRELSVKEFLFHVIVGLVKFGVFIGYIALISLMKDVRRVFMYHGAEHQSIFAFEAGEPLTVEYARRHQPLHPRCGTTFLILVIALSILVFSLVFPLLLWLVGEPTGIGWLDQALYVLIKLPLLLPIAGLAYELQRFTSRHMDSWWARALSKPGLALQRLTTRPPTDDQLEVALTSLRQTLWRENAGGESKTMAVDQVTVYKNFQEVTQAIEVATKTAAPQIE